MNLRNLKNGDAPFILEWMHSDEVIQYLNDDYSKCLIDDVIKYIKISEKSIDEQYFAIVNDDDEYMGTVGLRQIDKEYASAELTIVVRQSAMGKGYALYGMAEMIKKAFTIYNLEKIYWRVDEKNTKALRFFKKHGFNMLDEDIPEDILKRHDNKNKMVWFAVLKGDDYLNEALNRRNVAGCRVVRIKTIPTIEAGELSFFEGTRDINFDIKRVYYISKVPEGVRRGFHAHKELKQILFCPYGKIQLILENNNGREEITLSDPSIGIIIDKPTWREMLWLEKNSVLVVAASDYYKADDYIRDYDEFKKLING